MGSRCSRGWREAAPKSIPGHALIAYEEDFLEDGVIALCACGWKSERTVNAADASAAHWRHQVAVRDEQSKAVSQ